MLFSKDVEIYFEEDCCIPHVVSVEVELKAKNFVLIQRYMKDETDNIGYRKFWIEYPDGLIIQCIPEKNFRQVLPGEVINSRITGTFI